MARRCHLAVQSTHEGNCTSYCQTVGAQAASACARPCMPLKPHLTINKVSKAHGGHFATGTDHFARVCDAMQAPQGREHVTCTHRTSLCFFTGANTFPRSKAGRGHSGSSGSRGLSCRLCIPGNQRGSLPHCSCQQVHMLRALPRSGRIAWWQHTKAGHEPHHTAFDQQAAAPFHAVLARVFAALGGGILTCGTLCC